MIFAPHFETLLEARDTLILMGKTEDLQAFGKALNPE